MQVRVYRIATLASIETDLRAKVASNNMQDK